MSERDLTSETTEGPYYKKGSPTRADLLYDGVHGERLSLCGRVLDHDGKPLAGAWLDFWQADGDGNYDNDGFGLRGHQFSDESGRYALETVVPGSYPGRTPHIHVKVRPTGNDSEITTQLFFPGMPSNQTDSIFRTDLLIEISSAPAGKSGTFDFVVNAP